MSKNKQILIFSGIGLAVLGGVTAVLLLTAPEKAPEAEEDTAAEEVVDESLILTEKTEADVVSVAVANSLGEYNIIKSADSTEEEAIWTIEGLEDANILTSSLSSLVTKVSAMTAQQLVEENAEDLAKYGLSAPETVVTVNYGDEEFTFAVGNELPASTSEVYFCEYGENTVYTYSKSALSSFSNDKFSFIDTSAVPAYDQSAGEEVLKFTIDRIDLEKPIVIEQIPQAEDGQVSVFTYELTSPYNAYADLANAPNFIYSLFGLSAEKAVWFGMEEQDYVLSGLIDPSCEFTLETTLGTYTITLGNAVTEEVSDENGNITTEIAGVYGMSSAVPDTLFLFDTDDIAAFSIQPESIISQLFLMPYIYSLDNVEYSDAEGRSLTLSFETIPAEEEGENDEHKHYLNGELHDEQQVKNLYQYFISASGDELYFEEEKGELLATITYNYSDESEGKDVVQFYSSDADRHVIINVNGENLFKTKQIYLTRLYSNVESFLNGGEIVLTY